MLQKVNELAEHIDSLVLAVERYGLIPGVSVENVVDYRRIRDQLHELAKAHEDIMSRGLWVVLGKHVETGDWLVLCQRLILG